MARALPRRAPGPAEEPHPDPGAESRHLGPDRTEADDPQGLVAQLDPPEDPRLPAARTDAQEGRADVTRESKDQPEGVLGHRRGAIVGGVGDGDASPPGLGHVDVGRVADAEEADEAEPRALAEHLGVHDRVVEEHRLGRPEAVDELGPIPGGIRVVVDRPQPPERLEVLGPLDASRPFREHYAHGRSSRTPRARVRGARTGRSRPGRRDPGRRRRARGRADPASISGGR